MKEKHFKRWLLASVGALLALFLAANLVMEFTAGHDFADPLDSLTGMQGQEIAPDEVTLVVEHPELLTAKGLEERDGRLFLLLESTRRGSGDVGIEIRDKSGETIAYNLYYVGPDGLIIDRNNACFSHYRERQLCITLFFIGLCCLLWVAYFRSVRELSFSYHSIFTVGLAIWLTILCGILLHSYFSNEIMRILYGKLTSAARSFSIYTFPVVLVFAILLSVSNISLIRHEGFRLQNALGILISVLMVLGFGVLTLVVSLDDSGSETYFKIKDSVIELLYCVYAILECFLIGSVICGIRAAKHKPAYDKDCIIILGCMIRKDGTLFPLIRGRVDRAIRFYREQLAATGRKAVFIPSGGQGKNEPISEAEAMRRYLVEQGIAEEQILPEGQSVNTLQNMEFSKKLIGEGKKAVFSTTNYHVFRSGIISRMAGFEPEGMGSRTKWYFWPNAFVREVIGMLSYKWHSLLLILIPIVAFLTVLRFTF